MKTRIITALVAIAGIFPFFWFSAPVGNTKPLHYLFPTLIALIAFGVAFVTARRINGCLVMKLVPLLMAFAIMGIGFVFPLIVPYPAFRSPTFVSTLVAVFLNLEMPRGAFSISSFSSGDGIRVRPPAAYWNGSVAMPFTAWLTWSAITPAPS